MIRLILTGACALFLIGCSAKTDTPSNAGNPPAAAATDTSAKFELGKDI